jgi:hypothetical protein
VIQFGASVRDISRPSGQTGIIHPLLSRYPESFPGDKGGGGVNLNTHLHLVQGLEISGAVFCSHRKSLVCSVQLNTGTNFGILK